MHNALTVNILEKYISFDRIAEHVGVIPLNSVLFSKMLEDITPEEMEEIGRELGPRLIKGTFAFLDLDYDLDSLIENYFEPLGAFSRWYSFNIAGTYPNRRLLFEHAHGPKWSAFLKNYITSIIKSSTGTEPRVLVSDGLITVLG